MSAIPTALPPGPGLLAGFATLLRLKTGDMRLYEGLFRKYGDTVRLRAPQGDDIVMAFHPDGVQRVLLDHHKNYPKGRRYNELELVLGKGLVNSEGPLWQRQRRLVQNLFSKPATLGLVPVILRHARRLVNDWRAAGPRGERDLNADMLRATFNVAGEAFFGSSLDAHADAIRSHFKYALSVALRRMYALVNPPITWPLPSHRRFHAAMAAIDRVIYAIIDSYQGSTADNVLVRLMKLTDPETGERMDRRQLRDEINTILMVGHETSSVTITWALYLLTQHPEVCRRVVAEIDRELGGADPDAACLERLPYLNQVVQESLRYLPSVPFILRQAVAEDELGGYRIRAGSTICVCPWVTHRHPDFWPDPERFDPDRFAHQDRRERHRCAYLPFGAGQRICIGEFMAQLEVKILIILILQRYALRLAPGFTQICRGFISLHPVTGMRVCYEERAAPAVVSLPQGAPTAEPLDRTPQGSHGA